MILPWGLGGWWALSPHSPSALLQVTGVSLEGACAHLWWPSFYGCRSEDETLDSASLVASRACGHGPHRTIANKEKVLNWLSPQGSVQREQTKMPSPQSFFKSCCLNVWLPIRCWLRSSPLGHWQVLAQLQLLGVLRTKEATWTITKFRETNKS